MILRRWTGMVVGGAAMLLPVAGWAQAAAVGQEPPVPTLQVSSQLVLVPTAVRTKKGENIYGLTAEDFVVEADGVPQRVRMEDPATVQSLSLVVVAECSGTAWREAGKLDGLATMVDAMIGGAPAEVAVVQYGEGEELLSGFVSDPDARERAIHKLEPCDSSGVTTFDAVEYAAEILNAHQAKGRRVILLVSETRDHGSEVRADKVVEELGRGNIVVDTLSYSPLRDELLDDDLKRGATTSLLNPASLIYAVVQALRKNAPKELARLTGGEYANFQTGKKADQEVEGFANRVHNEYQLSFVPHFPQPAGSGDAAQAYAGLHNITVRVTKYPDAVLRHRGSFWVEQPTVK